MIDIDYRRQLVGWLVSLRVSELVRWLVCVTKFVSLTNCNVFDRGSQHKCSCERHSHVLLVQMYAGMCAVGDMSVYILYVSSFRSSSTFHEDYEMRL